MRHLIYGERRLECHNTISQALELFSDSFIHKTQVLKIIDQDMRTFIIYGNVLFLDDFSEIM